MIARNSRAAADVRRMRERRPCGSTSPSRSPDSCSSWHVTRRTSMSSQAANPSPTRRMARIGPTSRSHVDHRVRSDHAAALAQIRFFSSCMFSPRPRISLVSTSKLAGVPASSVFSPLTIDS